jgi:aryl-alcohol dehydrogenase-like predicted oxidoreductase
MRCQGLGRTELHVSQVSLGTVEIGLEDYEIHSGAPTPPDRRKAERLLHRALDLGINLIDTARSYGLAEGIIGRTLKARRSEYLIMSKVSQYPGEPERVKASIREYPG